MDQMTVFHNPIPKPLSDCEQKEIEKALECTGKKTTFEILGASELITEFLRVTIEEWLKLLKNIWNFKDQTHTMTKMRKSANAALGQNSSKKRTYTLKIYFKVK